MTNPLCEVRGCPKTEPWFLLDKAYCGGAGGDLAFRSRDNSVYELMAFFQLGYVTGRCLSTTVFGAKEMAIFLERAPAQYVALRAEQLNLKVY